MKFVLHERRKDISMKDMVIMSVLEYITSVVLGLLALTILMPFSVLIGLAHLINKIGTFILDNLPNKYIITNWYGRKYIK